MDTLAQLQALDPATLAPLVRHALSGDLITLIDWQVMPFGGGAGQCVYRVAGRAQTRETIASWSLIVKVTTPPPSVEDPAGARYWKREMLAYQSGLLADLPAGLSAPRCFGVTEQPGGDSWLWLEEITDAATGRWPPERFAVVARQLGTFSAAYLTGRALPADPWLSRDWFRSKVAEAEPVIARLPAVREHPLLRPALPGDAVDRVLRVWEERAAFFAALDRLPQTFCHLDAFPRNLFVRPHGRGAVQLIAIDWEFAGVSALGAEVAPLVGGSLLFDELDVAIADEIETAIVASYLAGLRAAGWQGDEALVRLGYAAALVLHYVFLLLEVVVVGTENEEFRQFVEHMQQRAYGAELERLAGIFAVLLKRADEARQLLRST